GDQTKREGEVIKQPELAETVKGIRDHGPDYFYDKVGESVADQVDEEVTEKDFKSDKTAKKEQVSTDYLNNKVYSASNPLGGTLMLQGLEIDEAINNQVPQISHDTQAATNNGVAQDTQAGAEPTTNNRLDYITGI